MGGNNSLINKGVRDIIKTGQKAGKDFKRIHEDAGAILTGKKGIILDPKHESRLRAEKETRAAGRAADKAASDASQAQLDQIKQNASNEATSGGEASIQLGGKRKNRKGGRVSSGMGLSTGATGLQT